MISLTFKDNKFADWVSTFEAIKNVIRDEYMRHSELFASTRLNPVEQNYLSKMQYDLLNEDEYDTLIQQGSSRNFYHEVIAFMRDFMSGGLKDNPSLAFGVLTGILRVSKENLFSGLNNSIVNSVLDEKYSEYFGFTES